VKRDRVITGVAAGLTALVLAACGAQSAAPSPTTGAPTTVAPTVAVPTLVPLPTSQPIQLGVTGIGEVKSVRDANLSFQVQGTVAQVFVKEGDVVKKGDLLAILDTRAFDQQLEQAKAALANALAQEAALTEAPRQADLNAARAAVCLHRSRRPERDPGAASNPDHRYEQSVRRCPDQRHGYRPGA
jgi:HlyD family secretion protein